MIAAHLEGPVRREAWVQTVEYDPDDPALVRALRM